MAITGAVKLFDLSANLLKNGATASATSGQGSVNYLLGLNRDTLWRSVGSMDSTPETVIVNFSSSQSINRIFLINHNFKNYTVKYNASGVWTNFASVLGVTGAKSNISETAYALDTSYYEFTPVTTDSIQIVINSTQIADQDKYLNQVTCCTELGTLAGYPIIQEIDVNRSIRANQTISGKYIVEKSIETVGFSLQMRKYAVSSNYTADFDLLMSLNDRETPFNVWLCGGKQGTTNFRVTLRGFRLRDLYQMQLIKQLALSYSDNIYVNSINAKFDLYEHI